MPPSIPSALAPYIQQCLEVPSLVLLTSVLETPANWLVIRFLLATLYGLDNNDERPIQAQTAGEVAGTTESKVVFLSIFRSYDSWHDLGKKLGLDLDRLQSTSRLAYIDGLSVHGFDSSVTTNHIRPRSLRLDDIKASINTALQSLVTNPQGLSKVTLMLDGLDFLLASQPDVTAVQAQQFVASLHEQVHTIVMTCSADGPLLHSTDASATSLELEHSIFVRTMAYQSSVVMQLRPLDTGHAKDVSGIVRVSQPYTERNAREELVDAEWLYHLKGDGSVRVWLRGE